MDDNVQVVKKFYEAFANKDAKAMLACYHPEVEFTDPVFGTLQASEAAAMWKMLVSRGGDDLVIRLANVEYRDGIVHADWEADYVFSTSGRMVYNKIHAQMEMKDGKIFRHVDVFDLHKWSSMAFGIKGTLFGGFPFFKNAVRKKAKYHLKNFIELNKVH